MVADHSEHTAANYFVHTGSGFQGNPSAGAWVTYGLGSECDNLPGYIVLDSGLIPPGGMDCFGSGFLPASYQGTLFRRGKHPIADIVPREPDPALQVGKLDLIRKLNRGVVQRLGSVSEIEATISNYELAFRMQSAVPELLDLSAETEKTKAMYGLDEDDTNEFGRQCLLARRMVGAWRPLHRSCFRRLARARTAGTSTSGSRKATGSMPAPRTSRSQPCSRI